MLPSKRKGASKPPRPSISTQVRQKPKLMLIQLRDELGRSLWTAGRLLARDRNLIELRQYREQATALIPHGQIKQVFPIIGMIDDNV